MTRFSVILPTRDRRQFVFVAIESVLRQTFTDWHLVVLDNGDEPVGDLSLLADARISYHRDSASGPADAFQKALELASGEIVYPLGDDDQLPPTALEVIDREIGEHEWLVGRTRCEDENGKVWISGCSPDVAELERNYNLGGAVCWKRSLSDRLGGFDVDFDGAADYELYLRFAHNAPAKFVDQVLYCYRDHPGTDSRVRAANQQAQAARIGT